MKLEINKLRSDEIEINIDHLIRQCMKRFKVVMVVAIVVAIILPTLVYLKDSMDYKNGKGEVIPEELSTSDQIGVDKYFLLNHEVQWLQEYGKNALVQQFTYSDMYQGRIQFHVDADEAIKFDLACALATYVNSGALAQKFCDTYDISKVAYIEEIFGAEVSGSKEGIPSGIVNFRVWASSKEDCEKYINFVITAMEAYSNQLKNDLADHTMCVIEREVVQGYVSEVQNKQMTQITNLNNAVEELEKQAENLSDEQWQIINSQNSLDPNEAQRQEAPKFSLIWAILGFVMGLIISIGVIVLQIIFGGKLQTEQELLKRLDINYLGSIYTTSKKRSIGIIEARILSCIEKHQVDKFAFISTCNNAFGDEISQLQKSFNERNVKCDLIENILGDANAFDSLKKYDKVFFVETLGKTSIKDAYEEAMVCLESKITVLGYVCIVD